MITLKNLQLVKHLLGFTKKQEMCPHRRHLPQKNASVSLYTNAQYELLPGF